MRSAPLFYYTTTDFETEYALMQKLIGEEQPYVFSHEESFAYGE
jgi:hypothetical protein